MASATGDDEEFAALSQRQIANGMGHGCRTKIVSLARFALRAIGHDELFGDAAVAERFEDFLEHFAP